VPSARLHGRGRAGARRAAGNTSASRSADAVRRGTSAPGSRPRYARWTRASMLSSTSRYLPGATPVGAVRAWCTALAERHGAPHHCHPGSVTPVKAAYYPLHGERHRGCPEELPRAGRAPRLRAQPRGGPGAGRETPAACRQGRPGRSSLAGQELPPGAPGAAACPAAGGRAHRGSGRSSLAGHESAGKTTPAACRPSRSRRSAASCCVSACDSMLRSAAQPDSADDALNACAPAGPWGAGRGTRRQGRDASAHHRLVLSGAERRRAGQALGRREPECQDEDA